MTKMIKYPAKCECENSIIVELPEGESLSQKRLDEEICSVCKKQGKFQGMPL